ncbi:5' exonuclease Apollo-like isoform X1 [Mangifera indica]|uniref:5' exonuclease Apollo-like isoform X1 n=1 Tax=Mangifera indica TaxID=29780 RepID=UPI001CFB77CC|nr:5' exonuclease Apollo-like isoform X1 [Mangifera indica]
MEKGLISVDQWTQGSQAYFLTHLHSDHTVGLTSSWSRGPLFCSRLTAKLLPFKFPELNLSLLHVLDIGSWLSISLISPSSGEKTVVQVMAIDAYHCPGSIMLLFRGEFGCQLYTGDFRWETDGEREKIARSTFLQALKDVSVDILYLDNTYCNPSYDFPSRQVAAQQVADIISSHPNHDIIIGIDTLGKEELLLHISRLLNIKIWVWPERLQTMHLLGFHDIFTTKTSLTRVRAVPRYSFSLDTLKGLNTMRPTIGIMPSGLPWLVKHLKENEQGSLLTSSYRSKKSSGGGIQTNNINDNIGSAVRLHKYIYSVPYSDHSCFMEIQEFIKLVQPVKVRGNISSSSCYVDPLHYFGQLCGANQPSRELHNSEERKSLGKRVIAAQTNIYVGSRNSTEAGRRRERARRVGILGVNMSRANTLRHIRRGAKIVESE